MQKLFIMPFAVLCFAMFSCSMFDNNSSNVVTFQIDDSLVQEITGTNSRSVSSNSNWTLTATLKGDYSSSVTTSLTSGVVSLTSIPSGAVESLDIVIKNSGYQFYKGTSDSFTVTEGANVVPVALSWNPENPFRGTWNCSYTYNEGNTSATVVAGTITFTPYTDDDNPGYPSDEYYVSNFTLNVKDEYKALIKEKASDFYSLIDKEGTCIAEKLESASNGKAKGDMIHLEMNIDDDYIFLKSVDGYIINYSDFINSDLTISTTFESGQTEEKSIITLSL